MDETIAGHEVRNPRGGLVAAAGFGAGSLRLTGDFRRCEGRFTDAQHQNVEHETTAP